MAFGAKALGIKLSAYLTDRVTAYKAQIQELRGPAGRTSDVNHTRDTILMMQTLVLVFEEFIAAIQYAAID